MEETLVCNDSPTTFTIVTAEPENGLAEQSSTISSSSSFSARLSGQPATSSITTTTDLPDQPDDSSNAVVDDDNTVAPASAPIHSGRGGSGEHNRFNSVHFGDDDFFHVVDEDDYTYGSTTWDEVCNNCCCHSRREWQNIGLGILLVVFFLYWFLFGLELLSSGAKVMSGCAAGVLFGDDTNPIAALMIGILSTAMLQSSSTTTSIIVSLTGPAISVNTGIYMVMGANIGTTITSTIVAMGQMTDGDQLERAFAGASVHDMFNFLTTAILLPLELLTRYLARITALMVRRVNDRDGANWEGPIKMIVAPLTSRIILSNREMIESIAAREGSCDSGGGFYPIDCANPNMPTADTCHTGLIACNPNTNQCPLLFQPYASAVDDKVSGGVVFFIGMAILFICLLGLIWILQKMLLGVSARIIYKATDLNGYITMLMGVGLTAIVQSSSVTTSALVPLCGIGLLRIEQMYALTLGANVGTTLTAVMAALVATGTGALQVALSHVFFNITGVIIWYPIPFLRRIPINLARALSRATRVWRGFPLLYISIAFFLLPLLFLGISMLFTQHKKGLTVLGTLLCIFIFLSALWTAYWCRFQGGRRACRICFEQRERKRIALRDLPDDIEYLKAQVAALTEHTGLLFEGDNVIEFSNITEKTCDTRESSADDNYDQSAPDE
jgi:sodium-dependent phosphate cotransporter